ncbi:hypothetical protein D3C84_798690 [compost metagenome]
MHIDAAGLLTRVVRHRDDLAVLALKGMNSLFPCQVLLSIFESWKVVRIRATRFPINPHRHSRRPFRRRAVAPGAAAALVGADDVHCRTAIDTEAVDGPVGVVDAVESAGLGAEGEQAGGEAAEAGYQRSMHGVRVLVLKRAHWARPGGWRYAVEDIGGSAHVGHDFGSGSCSGVLIGYCGLP